jgi:hypothetical protein
VCRQMGVSSIRCEFLPPGQTMQSRSRITREEQTPQVEAPTGLPGEPRNIQFADEDAGGRAPEYGRPIADAENQAPLFAEEPVAGSPVRRVPSSEETPLFADEDDFTRDKGWRRSSTQAASALILGAVLFLIALGAFPRNAPLLRGPDPDQVVPQDTSVRRPRADVPLRPMPPPSAPEDEAIPVTAQSDVSADVSPSIEPVPSPAGAPPTSPREDPPALPALQGIPAIAGTAFHIAPPPYPPELRSDPAGAELTTEVTSAPADEAAGVREVLARYVDAYAALDAGAVAVVWPTVDQPALGRAFEALLAQNIRFNRCSVTVSGATALAMCAGTVVWTPRVGSRRSREDERTWTFSLTQRDASWAIVSTEVR